MGYLQPLAISFAGAIIAASLAFYVRAKLDAHALRTAELRIAYVHYVRFSQFLAVEVAIKGLAKSLAPAAIMEKLGKSDAGKNSPLNSSMDGADASAITWP